MNNEEKKKKKFIDRKWNQILIVLALILVGAIVLNYAYQENLQEDDVTITIVPHVSSTLGQRLTDNGWQLISAMGCPACDAQKQVFKDIHNLKVFECNINQATVDTCTGLGIEAVPTWYNKNTNHSILGYQTAIQLEELIV